MLPQPAQQVVSKMKHLCIFHLLQAALCTTVRVHTYNAKAADWCLLTSAAVLPESAAEATAALLLPLPLLI